MDPYLEKRAREEARLKKQIEQNLGPDAVKKLQQPAAPSTPTGPEPVADNFVMSDGGVLIPPSAVPQPATAAIYGIPVVHLTADKMKAALAAVKKQIIDGDECDCPRCTLERKRGDEQAVLRALHNRRYEYVWSNVLKCHVRIGERHERAAT